MVLFLSQSREQFSYYCMKKEGHHQIAKTPLNSNRRHVQQNKQMITLLASINCRVACRIEINDKQKILD
jgi:hypothetical protein